MTFQPVKLLHVKIKQGTSIKPVGRLALKNQQIWFEYDEAWLQENKELSPFKLPLKAGAFCCEDRVFDGLFGVFNDSLPDGWGRLLVDRTLRQQGIAPEQLTPLDRLAHVGLHGMGALIYEPDYSDYHAILDPLNLNMLAQEAQHILQGETNHMLDELLQLNGSSGGARPKVLVAVNKTFDHIIHGETQFNHDYEPWLIKFASSQDPEDIGAIEFAYNHMAHAAGLKVMPSFLFPANKGTGYFGIKRFDSVGQNRIHMHSACGLLHADYRAPTLDYENLLRATLFLTKAENELINMFRITVFNVLAHNRDDHSKNIAFLMQESGQWQTAPAYDLTFSYGFGGEHNMMILGEGKNPSVRHLKKLAAKFSIGNAEEIIQQVQHAVKRWPEFAEEAGVSRISKRLIMAKLAENIF